MTKLYHLPPPPEPGEHTHLDPDDEGSMGPPLLRLYKAIRELEVHTDLAITRATWKPGYLPSSSISDMKRSIDAVNAAFAELTEEGQHND